MKMFYIILFGFFYPEIDINFFTFPNKANLNQQKKLNVFTNLKKNYPYNF